MEKLLQYIMLFVLFCCIVRLVQVKRFRAAVWKKLKGNNDSLELNVTERKTVK